MSSLNCQISGYHLQWEAAIHHLLDLRIEQDMHHWLDDRTFASTKIPHLEYTNQLRCIMASGIVPQGKGGYLAITNLCTLI